MLIALQRFGGQRPRVSARLLSPAESQIARNCKLWEGTLQPWFRPALVEDTVNPGPTRSIYRYADAGYWLHWPTDVDVVRGPIAGTQRLYWTGDGQPKFGNVEVIAGVTALTADAAQFQNFVVVGNALGFAPNNSITIALNSGSHTTRVTTVELSLNRINLATPLAGAASAGNAVKQNSLAYPHGSYLMGVPAPAAPLSGVASTTENGGTVVGIPSVFGESTFSSLNGTADFAQVDLALDSQGRPITFEIFAGLVDHIYGTQDVTFSVQVIRDPLGLATVIHEETFSKTFQGTNAGNNQPTSGPPPKVITWCSADGGSELVADFGRSSNNIRFPFTPPAGMQTYRLKLSYNIIQGSWGGPGNNIPELRITATSADVTVKLNRADHGLIEGDRIQFGAIVGSGTLEKLNGDPVSVLAVNGDLVTVKSDAAGVYTSGGTWQQVWDDADLEARSYVYTYVASLDGHDMEGPPSPPSAIFNVGDNQVVNLTGFIDPRTLGDGRPYSVLRIYRTSTGTAAEAPFLFVAEISIAATSYRDIIRATNLGEIVPSQFWDPPPNDLIGLIELPNGGLAGFRKDSNELCLCVPYQPHAWPITYRHAMLDTIVGIAAFGTSIMVGTKGRPTVVTGIDPASLSEEHIEVVEPTLSKRGTVDMGYGVLYPTETGLCYVAQGQAQIITAPFFTEDQWRALNPSSFIAAEYGGRYVCFYDNGTEQAGFMLDPREPEATLTFLDLYATEVWTDPRTGKLYLVLVNSAGIEQIREWNTDLSAAPAPYRWRSKKFVNGKPVAMRVVKVDAELYPVNGITVNLFADEKVYASIDAHDSRPIRVNDSQGRARVWEVEVVGDAPVNAVYVAPNMESLTRYLG